MKTRKTALSSLGGATLFPNSVSLGSSPIVKVPEQGFPKVPKNRGSQRFPKVPKNRFPNNVLKQEFPSKVSNQGFPSKGAKNRFQEQVSKQGCQEQVRKQGPQARFSRTGSQDRLPSKVRRKRFPRTGFEEQVCRNRFPRTGSQARLPIKGSQAKLPATDLQARCPGRGVQAKFLLSVYLKQLPNIIPTNSCWLFHVYIIVVCCCWGYSLGLFFFRGARFLRLKPSGGLRLVSPLSLGSSHRSCLKPRAGNVRNHQSFFLRLRLCHASSNQPK